MIDSVPGKLLKLVGHTMTLTRRVALTNGKNPPRLGCSQRFSPTLRNSFEFFSQKSFEFSVMAATLIFRNISSCGTTALVPDDRKLGSKVRLLKGAGTDILCAHTCHVSDSPCGFSATLAEFSVAMG
jgi:hypothetical protein